MQLGFHTNGLQNHRLDDGLRLLADHGYEVVALTPDVGHLDPFHCTPREVAAIAALLQQLRLRVVIETGARFVLDPRQKHEPTLMTRDATARARRLDYYRRCAQLGRELGAEVLSFWAGIDRQPGPDSTKLLREGVLATAELVRAHGLVPAFEPEPGMAVATVAQWRELQAALGSAAPALTLDIGHLYVEWEGEPARIVGDVSPLLRQVHLEDMRRGDHEHLLPGTGDVDFAAVLTAMRTAGYRGPVCFELARSSHQAPTAVQVCADLFRRHVAAAAR